MKFLGKNLYSENVGLGSKSCKKWYLLMYKLMWCKTARNKGTGWLAVS